MENPELIGATEKNRHEVISIQEHIFVHLDEFKESKNIQSENGTC